MELERYDIPTTFDDDRLVPVIRALEACEGITDEQQRNVLAEFEYLDRQVHGGYTIDKSGLDYALRSSRVGFEARRDVISEVFD